MGSSNNTQNAASKTEAAKTYTVDTLITASQDELLNLLTGGQIDKALYMQVLKAQTDAAVAQRLKTAGGKPTNGKGKTVCPLTLEEFTEHAEPMAIRVANVEGHANVKAPFSSGSFGWNYNGKVMVNIGGKQTMCQIGVNVTVIGSKEASGQA